jgi:hypothetical protein
VHNNAIPSPEIENAALSPQSASLPFFQIPSLSHFHGDRDCAAIESRLIRAHRGRFFKVCFLKKQGASYGVPPKPKEEGGSASSVTAMQERPWRGNHAPHRAYRRGPRSEAANPSERCVLILLLVHRASSSGTINHMNKSTESRSLLLGRARGRGYFCKGLGKLTFRECSITNHYHRVHLATKAPRVLISSTRVVTECGHRFEH